MSRKHSISEGFQNENTVWQVSAGSDQRNYAADFLRFGLAFVGGGKQIKAISQVKPGDLLVLKRGKSAVVAAGEIVDRGLGHFGQADKQWPRWHLLP